ncbi:MAG: hypothetical protein IJB79_03385 [Candidatus Gastranaerophilales bacterium]|nr:hypothetical protein [Candidatus Gastranaerophilales bacterium]
MRQIYKIISKIKTNADIEKFFSEIFTENELEILSKRWRILELLSKGVTQREIANELNVSLCKVTRGAKILKDKNAITTRFLNKGIEND